VLACLLEGDSEQQCAARLGLTRDTTHQYVKSLYRRLDVNTRGELMARFVRFPAKILAAS
jgi:DNA-binding CsgD family transcriptional regulator